MTSGYSMYRHLRLYHKLLPHHSSPRGCTRHVWGRSVKTINFFRNPSLSGNNDSMICPYSNGHTVYRTLNLSVPFMPIYGDPLCHNNIYIHFIIRVDGDWIGLKTCPYMAQIWSQRSTWGIILFLQHGSAIGGPRRGVLCVCFSGVDLSSKCILRVAAQK